MKTDMNHKMSTKFFDRVVLTFLGGYVFFASIFHASFAELHVKLSWLNFPIFIGEIVLGLCLLCLGLKLWQSRYTNKNFYIGLCIFFVWLLSFAFVGYAQWGPLSFRNAALFYYMLFAVIAYFCFDKTCVIDYKGPWLILSVLVLSFGAVFIYHQFFYILLIAGILLKLKNKALRYSGIGILLLFCFISGFFIQGSRGHLLGVLISCIFLFLFFAKILIRSKLWKYGLVIFIVLSWGLGFYFFGDRSNFKSMTNIKQLVSSYHDFNNVIEEKKKDFKINERPINLFVDNQQTKKKEEYKKIKVEHVEKVQDIVSVGAAQSSGAPVEREEIIEKIQEKSEQKKSVSDSAPKEKHRNIEVAYNNILFRVFIWKDMVEELIQHQAWFGLGFGKPQRSISLEAVGWAEDEIAATGWITPHNSFLHMIYRAGIIGLGLILGMCYALCYMLRIFLKHKSFTGGLILAGLLYFIVLANTLVILEFPHYAILFWGVFGVAIAYANQLEKRNTAQTSL